MAERRGSYHIVARSVTAETFSLSDCPNHHHINYRELKELHASGDVAPPEGIREHAKDWEGREPDYLLEWVMPGVLRYKRDIPHRGLSSKYGWYLAQELRKNSPVARVNIADIQRHR